MIVAFVVGVLIALAGPLLASLRRRRRSRRTTSSTTGPDRFADECEVCGDLATHELRVAMPRTGDLPVERDHTGTPLGGTEMAATYCAEHAPDGAVAFDG